MSIAIHATNISIVVLDVLLVWGCFAVDSYLRCLDADDLQYQAGQQRSFDFAERRSP